MSERLAGVLIPVFSARREGDLGIGDVRALIEWLELAAEKKVGFLQLLPINEMASDDSPYNALSSVALEPLFLTMEEVPGLEAGDLAGARQALGDGEWGRVSYEKARSVKGALIAKAWERWDSQSDEMKREFAGFREAEGGWVEDYGIYRSLCERHGGEAWEEWPEDSRTPEGARGAADPARVDFFVWVQWLCYRQWRAARRRADELGVKLMGDIPIGVNRNSADVFFGREDFDLDWCGGAPREKMFGHDKFIRKWGQNWGIPLYRWDKMEAEGFPWWRRRIEKLTDVFHIFRIDHILGFYRIYAFPWRPERNEEFLKLTQAQAAERTGGELPKWVPRPDKTKRDKAQNRDDGDRRLRAIQEAAGGAAVVGEDLGAVADYVRPHLESLGIPGFRIPHWDADEEGKVIPGGDFPECSFTTYATHDHDPIAAMWEDYRRQAREEESEPAQNNLDRLCDFAGIEDQEEFDDDKKWRLIGALLGAASRYAGVLVNDLTGGVERINSPGTVGPDNWSYRFPRTAGEFAEDPLWARWIETVEATGRG